MGERSKLWPSFSMRGQAWGRLLVLLAFMGAVAPCLSHSPLVSEIMDQGDMGEEAEVAPTTKAPDLVEFTARMGNLVEQMKVGKTDWVSRLEEVRNSVVQLRIVQEKFMWSIPYRTPMRETIFGSGWFIDKTEFGVDIGDDIIIVTNAHVAKQASSISILIPELGKEPIPGEAVGVCVQRDMALVRVKDPAALLKMFKQRTGRDNIQRMKLGDSDQLPRGAAVMAVGYPLGMQNIKASVGIVSGYQQFKSSLYLSITAPINPGNSGGPLFNTKGEVVGINSAKFAQASGIAFAIPSKQVKVALDGLYLQREFIEPDLGITTSVGTANLNEYLTGLKSTGGVYIKEVYPEGLFAQAGGMQGDLLLAIDEHKVDRFGKIWMELLKDRVNTQGLLLRHKVGTKINFHVYRADTAGKGKLIKLTTTYKFTKRPSVHFLYEPVVERPRFVAFAGFVFMKLNLNLVEKHLAGNPQELVKYTDVANRDDDAIIISSVEPGSLAAKDGAAVAAKGLLVQKINGMGVRTMDDLCAALSARTSPEEFWTLETSKTFTALKVGDVLNYEKSEDGQQLKVGKFEGCSKKEERDKLESLYAR